MRVCCPAASHIDLEYGFRYPRKDINDPASGPDQEDFWPDDGLTIKLSVVALRVVLAGQIRQLPAQQPTRLLHPPA